jgi:hypothetical protein
MGAILSAVILESHFRPKLFPRRQLEGILEELYEALMPSPLRPQVPKALGNWP